jgi:hypothetical protein
MAVFARDGFVDRYSGERLVFPGTLRLLAKLLPNEFLGDGRARSRHDIVAALAGQHARDEVVRTLMRLAVTGRLVETERKYRLAPPAEPGQS